jgi:hypothetical protein
MLGLPGDLRRVVLAVGWTVAAVVGGLSARKWLRGDATWRDDARVAGLALLGGVTCGVSLGWDGLID